jgi:hypothetical protein
MMPHQNRQCLKIPNQEFAALLLALKEMVHSDWLTLVAHAIGMRTTRRAHAVRMVDASAVIKMIQQLHSRTRKRRKASAQFVDEQNVAIRCRRRTSPSQIHTPFRIQDARLTKKLQAILRAARMVRVLVALRADVSAATIVITTSTLTNV